MEEARKQYLTKNGERNKRSIVPRILREYPVDELDFVAIPGKRLYEVDGISYVIKMQSSRLKVFHKSRKCAACGIEGDTLLLEQHSNNNRFRRSALCRAHFELYAKKDGLLVLMTKDHIIPRSKGGSNSISNLQTMCMDCNSFKENRLLTLNEIARKEADHLSVCPMCDKKLMKKGPCPDCYSWSGERIQEAIDCANKLHKGMYRKYQGVTLAENGIRVPYLVHPINVLKRLVSWDVGDYSVLAAGVLHDAIEDGFKGKGEVVDEALRIESVKNIIISSCNKDVLAYVEELTFLPENPANQTKVDYMASFYSKSPQAIVIKIADRFENVEDFMLSDPRYAKKYLLKANSLFDAFRDREKEIIAINYLGERVCSNIRHDLERVRKLVAI